MLDFDSFTKEIADRIRDYLPEEYQDAIINIRKTEKLNESYTGMEIRKPDAIAAPVINLSAAYQNYQNESLPLEEIMTKIADMTQVEPPEINMKKLEDYSQVKNQLFIKVRGIFRNEEILENAPHMIQENLAITYHIKLDHPGHEMMSCIVTNDMLEHFGISNEDLHRDAMENSPKILPPSIQPMMEVMGRMFNENREMISDPSGMDFDTQIQKVDHEGMDIYVLSNTASMDGASAIFYPDVMDRIGEQMEKDFFILPSSIHETLIIMDDGRYDRGILEAMVREVNETQVSPEDQLSNSVYHYDSREHLFERAEVFEQRQNEKVQESAEHSTIREKLVNAEKECEKQNPLPGIQRDKEAAIG